MKKETRAGRSHTGHPSTRQVLADSLRLKPRQRMNLARRLLASVERDPSADQDLSFDAMLLRRFEEMRSGAVKGQIAGESLAMVLRGIRQAHAGKFAKKGPDLRAASLLANKLQGRVNRSQP